MKVLQISDSMFVTAMMQSWNEETSPVCRLYVLTNDDITSKELCHWRYGSDCSTLDEAIYRFSVHVNRCIDNHRFISSWT